MPRPSSLRYADAGVNLIEKDSFTDSLESVMRRTHGPRVIPNPGGFAGLFRLDFNEKLFARNYKDPVLVACADGVGTKLKLAVAAGVYDTIGIDLVAMNVNDLIVQGAEPLFFLDYIAVDKVRSERLTAIVRGVAEGCRLSGCALLGGETAEMPGVYAENDFDLAGFAVGVVELKRIPAAERVRPGDRVIGIASSGVHSNGFSLVRKIVDASGLDLHAPPPKDVADSLTPAPASKRPARTPRKPASDPGGGRNASGRVSRRTPARAAAPVSQASDAALRPDTLGRALLTPTRIYARTIARVLHRYPVKKVVTGMAHITGSGMEGNLCRALNPGVDAVIDRSAWPVPPVFRFLQKHGNVPEDEMRRVFNMGIGYTLIVRPAFAGSILAQLKRLGERAWLIGTIEKGSGLVREIA